MIQEFLLPDLGEGLPEAELVSWLVSVGDTVTINQTIAEVETAKAVVELPSPHAGVVQSLHAAAGDVVAVGAPLISYEIAGSNPEEPTPEAAATARGAESGVVNAPPNLVGYGAAPETSGRPARRPRGARTDTRTADTALLEAAPHDALREGEGETPREAERPRSTPPVRKLAKDLGVDLALVEARGAFGVITRADVEEYAARVGAASAPASASPPAPARPGGDASRTTRIPIRSVRRHTAEAMVRSAFTAPHVTTFLTVDVTPTIELIASLKADRSLVDHRIGVLAIAAKAVCLALSRTPGLNAKWDDSAGEIVHHHYVNLGIAAATERGLLVPHVVDADGMDLVRLADAIAALAANARAGTTPPADMIGGTFSITNVGVFGVDAGTPIINPGEAGILALGAVRRRPWEHQGGIALRDVMTLSLSFDHRMVDGAEGARFLADVGGILREPGRAMLLG